VNINPDKAKYKISAARPEDCAFICLNGTQLVSDKFACYSFDFCKKDQGFLCTFYAATHISDPSLVVQDGGNVCDHFSSMISKTLQLSSFLFSILSQKMSIHLTLHHVILPLKK
jgi:hypothetical protein